MAGSTAPPRNIAVTALAFEGGLGVVALAGGWWLGRWPLPGWRFGDAGGSAEGLSVLWGVAATVPMLIGMWAADRYDWRPLRPLKRDFDALIVPLFARTSVVELALISLAAGWGEELLFRGLIQDGLAVWWGGPQGPWLALGVASVVFGLGHMISVTYAVVAAVIGLYLGGLLLATDHILAPITAHGLYDFCALLYLVRFRRSAEAPPATKPPPEEP